MALSRRRRRRKLLRPKTRGKTKKVRFNAAKVHPASLVLPPRDTDTDREREKK
jgi:hypothetical protein